jgi:hypothetical protein
VHKTKNQKKKTLVMVVPFISNEARTVSTRRAPGNIRDEEFKIVWLSVTYNLSLTKRLMIHYLEDLTRVSIESASQNYRC